MEHDRALHGSRAVPTMRSTLYNGATVGRGQGKSTVYQRASILLAQVAWESGVAGGWKLEPKGNVTVQVRATADSDVQVAARLAYH